MMSLASASKSHLCETSTTFNLPSCNIYSQNVNIKIIYTITIFALDSEEFCSCIESLPACNVSNHTPKNNHMTLKQKKETALLRKVQIDLIDL